MPVTVLAGELDPVDRGSGRSMQLVTSDSEFEATFADHLILYPPLMAVWNTRWSVMLDSTATRWGGRKL